MVQQPRKTESVKSDTGSWRTRTVVVADLLRQAILDGELAPGTPLRQVEVARKFGVSTTPIREAFATLTQEGLVVRDPHRGVVVFTPLREEIGELYEIRIELESLAARLATPRIADVDLDEAQVFADKMIDCDDPALREQYNRSFHGTIYRQAGRPRLAGLIDQLRDTSSIYLRYLQLGGGGHSDLRREVNDEHQAIIDALRLRDADAAAEATRLHLFHSIQQIREALRRVGH